MRGRRGAVQAINCAVVVRPLSQFVCCAALAPGLLSAVALFAEPVRASRTPQTAPQRGETSKTASAQDAVPPKADPAHDAARPKADSANEPAAAAEPRVAPARELLRELCREPRLASTPSAARAASWLADRLRAAGFEVELDARRVVLSLPRRLAFAIHDPAQPGAAIVDRITDFDPDAAQPRDVPLFNSWTPSGSVRAPVVHVGRGLREDYRRLRELGVDPRGAIALAQYGGAYRGIKVDLAAEYGCVGVLLYTPASEDGSERGETWPAGPWKPPHEAQRGSISPMGRAPGDPSTPGWPSPAPDVPGRRLELGALGPALPRIPCLPIGWADAHVLLERLAPSRVIEASAGQDGSALAPLVGPGPVEVELSIDAPLELRTIVNVVATLRGTGPLLVVLGNHRDSWVRGANDAGSGTVALLRAAQRLGERARGGWKPSADIQLGFWDAEEHGLIGSTEWAEAHASRLRQTCIAYVNADAAVSGDDFFASGTPGLGRALLSALRRTDALRAGEQHASDLAPSWSRGERGPAPLGLPGSGSDFAAFLHHLGLPVLDIGFGGARAGQYHTAFDDFELVERYLDPDFETHETAGALLAELACELAESGHASFDWSEAAHEMARQARLLGLEAGATGALLGREQSERLASAFEALARAAADVQGAAPQGVRFYEAFHLPEGLEGRTWFKNRLWAPGLETGYSSETFPELRAAARRGEMELRRALGALIESIEACAAELGAQGR